MVRIRINTREFAWDPAAPITAGDLAAARELGLGLDGLQALFGRLSAAIGRDPAQGRMLELAELVVQVAFLAAARQDHQLRYRDFAYSVSLDDLTSIGIDGGDTPAEDAAAPGRPAGEASLGAALAEAGAAAPPAPAATKPKRTRKPRTTTS